MKLCGSCVPCSDGVGEPKKPPCVSCHNSGSQCVLVESRRGRKVRSTQPGQIEAVSSNRPISNQDNASGAFEVPLASEHEDATPFNYDSDMDQDDYEERTKDESLRMELRNPSDALQILARSRDASSNKPSSHRWRQRGQGSAEIAHTNSSKPGSSSSTDNAARMSNAIQERNHGGQPTIAIDNYDLVKRGLLHPSILPELLLK